MKKILALVLAFCLVLTILPAAADSLDSLLSLFGISDGESGAQGVAGTVSGSDGELSLDSLESLFGGSEGIFAGDSEDILAGLGNMLGGTEESDGIYSGDGEDELPGSGSILVGTGTVENGPLYTGSGEDEISGLGNIFGSAENELNGSDSMLGGSSSGLDLGSLGGLLGGDGSGLDLGSLGGLLGGDGSGLDLGSLGGLLGGGETAPVNTVPAESQEQFYGTWEIISLRVGGYEIGMDMLKQFGLEVTSSMTATLTADSVSLAEKDGKAETKPIAAAEFTEGALTITVEDTPARLQLTDTGNLLCTVSGAQYGVDITLDIIFARVQ